MKIPKDHTRGRGQNREGLAPQSRQIRLVRVVYSQYFLGFLKKINIVINYWEYLVLGEYLVPNIVINYVITTYWEFFFCFFFFLLV